MAAKRAGYKQPHVQGNQVLENVRVKEYIKQPIQWEVKPRYFRVLSVV